MAGTQAIERATVLLRELASRGSVGWRLSDLARRCELDKGTTHRIVACLVRERLARQRPHDRRYVPGPLLFELGLALPGLAAFQSSCAAPLERLAGKLGGVSFVYLRSGNDFVCIASAGSVAARGLSHEVGLRRPLALSAGGAAILVALPPDEARAIIAENMRRVRKAGEVRARAVERMLRRSQNQGYGVHLGDIVPGVNTCGVAIRARDGGVFGSISVAGAAEDFPPPRVAHVVAALEQEAVFLGDSCP